MDVNETLAAILKDAGKAAGKFGQPTSTHESLGVLLEEFDELKEAIHANASDKIYKEAVQVASVAYRLALALHGGDVAFYYRSGLDHSALSRGAA